MCGKPVAEPPLACPGCGTMFYCSDKHMRGHSRLGHDLSECGRMAAQAARRQELAGHPFPWAPATHHLQPCAWLKQLWVHSTPGAWLRECPCGGPASVAGPWGAAGPLLAHLLTGSPAAAEPSIISREALLEQLGDWMGMSLSQAPCLLSRVRAAAAGPTVAACRARRGSSRLSACVCYTCT